MARVADPPHLLGSPAGRGAQGRSPPGSVSHRTSPELLDTLLLVPVDDGVLEVAGMLDPASMRSLDAIHVATARYLGSDLDALVTYDLRMIEGANLLGIPIASPA